MKTIFTTQDFPENKRLSSFRDVIKNNFLFTYECQRAERLADQRFYASVAHQQISDLNFITIHSNGHNSVAPPDKGFSNEATFYIEFQRSGCGTFTQDGRKAFLRQGDFAFFDLSRPVSWSFESDYSLYKIIIPRDKLSRKIGNTKNLTGRAIRGNTLMGGLVYSFFLKYMPALDSVDSIYAQHLGNILLDLITAALSELSLALPTQSMGHATLLYMAQQYIEDNLHNPALAPEDCAKACGISLRYLQELFQNQNTTIHKWLWQKRLELYKDSLSNPLMAGKNITQIAYDCGFSDISNLSRKFKTSFSMTASEYREKHASHRN